MKDWRLLERVLSARDERARAREAEQRSSPSPDRALGELTLNVPGWPKIGRLWAVTFTRGLRAFLAESWSCGPGAVVLGLRTDDAGYWALLGGPQSPEVYKAVACRVEEGAPGGRLLDFDWYRAGGDKIPRESLGFPSRTCLVCGGPQGDCLSTLRHPLPVARDRATRLVRRGLAGAEVPHAP